jgi:hypothetical protein
MDTRYPENKGRNRIGRKAVDGDWELEHVSDLKKLKDTLFSHKIGIYNSVSITSPFVYFSSTSY